MTRPPKAYIVMVRGGDDPGAPGEPAAVFSDHERAASLARHIHGLAFVEAVPLDPDVWVGADASSDSEPREDDEAHRESHLKFKAAIAAETEASLAEYFEDRDRLARGYFGDPPA
jgi:hypothetical protein